MTTSKDQIKSLHEKEGTWSDAKKLAGLIQKGKAIKYNKAQSVVALILSDDFLTKVYHLVRERIRVHNYRHPRKKKAMPRLNIFLEWARGTGKSVILGLYLRKCMTHLPRGIGVLVGASYQQILTRTLPSTIFGLEKQGLIKDIHYFVGRKAPESWGWPEAYQPPLKYDHAIQFYTGYTMVMVSQDKIGDGRGINSDNSAGDEAAMLNYEKLQTDVWATNRGSFREMFKNDPFFGSNFYMSSTPLTAKGQWFTDMESKAQQDQLTYFLRAKSRDNEYLPDSWFEEMKSMMDDWIYNAEIENIRPKGIKDGFYPSFNEDIHTYTDGFDYDYYESFGFDNLSEIKVNCQGDSDHDVTEPIVAGIDWGHRINCMACGQRRPFEFRFTKNLFVKGKFCDN